MERLTCNVNNHISLAYSDEDDLGWEETAKKLMYRLAKYEDEAERREKGCEYCKGVTKTGAIRLEDDFGRPLNYCPECGRKLVD